MAFNAKTIKNFIQNDQCQLLVNYAKQTDKWEKTSDPFWDGRVLRPYLVPDPIKNTLRTILFSIKKTIELEYNLDQEIFPDTYDMIRWFPGMSQEPHCDDMSGTSAHNHFGHRYFGCVLYLNEDYEGGHTFYPKQNFDITPEIGKLAIHLGDCEHMHGVTEIKNNTRYTIASFWTFDKTRSSLYNF